MKYKTNIFIIIFLLFSTLGTFAQKVSNVHFEQVEEKIHIYYDLETEESCTVFLFFKESMEHNWGKPLEHISGDMGIGQTNGKNKMIVWDVLKDRTNIVGNIHFKVDAFHESGMRLYNDMIPHPSYFVTCFVVDSEQEAKEKVYLLKTQGLKAHYYWIPDIDPKGNKYFKVVVGPYKDMASTFPSLTKVQEQINMDAYVLKMK